jgi:hypothetical protein
MPRKLRANKSKRRELTIEQDLALGLGACSLSEIFGSPGHARESWFQHREHLMLYAGSGHRPEGWWLFEANESRPRDSAAEAARLVQLGQLSDAEVAEIRANGRLGIAHKPIADAVEAALAGTWKHEPEDDDASPEERLWWRGAGVRR